MVPAHAALLHVYKARSCDQTAFFFYIQAGNISTRHYRWITSYIYSYSIELIVDIPYHWMACLVSLPIVNEPPAGCPHKYKDGYYKADEILSIWGKPNQVFVRQLDLQSKVDTDFWYVCTYTYVHMYVLVLVLKFLYVLYLSTMKCTWPHIPSDEYAKRSEICQAYGHMKQWCVTYSVCNSY